MAVHTQESGLKLLAMIFEARYDEGYRYLDHSGELLVRIKRHNPHWAVALLGQKGGQLTHHQHKLVANIGLEKLDLATTERLDLSHGEKQARLLGEAAEELYSLTVEVLKVPRTTRIGTRLHFMA